VRPSVWFIVPAHGRFALTAVCLRQLARTCETLADSGVDASAVVIADDANLQTADDLGFGTIQRVNQPLGRRWNDGYELAGKTGIDYVIPFGSDDWIDPNLVLAQLEADGELRCSRLSSVVSEDGRHLARLTIKYPGHLDFGDGVRVIPTELLQRLGYRPAEEDRPRAIDTSVFINVERMLGRRPRVSFVDLYALQIVDFKSDVQLNDYAGCLSDRRLGASESSDPWDELAAVYPAEAVDEMAAVYGVKAVAA
jgi:glycosyltransferase involved in cell wall biosynthesis